MTQLNPEQRRRVAEAVTEISWKHLNEFIVAERLSAECWQPEIYSDIWKVLVEFIANKFMDNADLQWVNGHRFIKAIATNDIDALEQLAFQMIGESE